MIAPKGPPYVYSKLSDTKDGYRMPGSSKQFAERLNHCLDDTGAPYSARERASILSKMLDIPKQNAWSLVEGHQIPEPELLQRIANEFEVDPEWLSGKK